MFEIENGKLIKCISNDEVIALPLDCTEIVPYAFKNCNAKEIIFNVGLVKIDSYAFYGSKIEKIIFPCSLNYIGENAFKNCFNLSLVQFNEGLEIIGDDAFSFTKIKNIYIPASIINIGVNPFADCFKLEEIVVDKNNIYYSSFDKTNTICEKSTNRLITGCKKSVIEESIIEIAENAFRGVGLKNIDIPNNVTYLSKQCFANNLLTNINLNNVCHVYDGVFMDNNCLEKIIFSNKMKTIHSFIISGCDKLNEIILPDNIDLISTDSFSNFLGSKIVIPNSVKVIESKVFSCCTRLKQINFLGTREEWYRVIGNRNVFYKDKKPVKYTVCCSDGILDVDVFDINNCCVF